MHLDMLDLYIFPHFENGKSNKFNSSIPSKAFQSSLAQPFLKLSPSPSQGVLFLKLEGSRKFPTKRDYLDCAT